MSFRFRFAAAFACTLLACASTTVRAQSARPDAAPIQGQLSLCAGCHGIPGYKTAYPVVYHVPKIGGQSPAYLANALKAYRGGERRHPSMRGIAASLSDADIDRIAAYYGGGK